MFVCVVLLLLAYNVESYAKSTKPAGVALPVSMLIRCSGQDDIDDWGIAECDSPDWSGVWRDTGVVLGAQVFAAGVTYTLPESVSSWSREQKQASFKSYTRNFTNPVFDKDKFYINYVLHPYWGSTYFTRARERGLDKTSSFVYSALMSTMFEFGIECFFEKPSIQDLIVTPVIGSLVANYLFEPLRISIKRKQDLQWYDHAALIATDPLGVLSSGFEHVTGVKSTIKLDVSLSQLQNRTTVSELSPSGNRFGVVLQFPLN